MTANATRRGYEWDILEPRSVALCRPHPKEPVELRCFMGHGDCITIKISRDSLRSMAIEAPRLYITDGVAA